MCKYDIERRLLLIVSFFNIIIFLLFVSCSNQVDEVTAGLGQEVELQIGQTVSIEEEQIRIKFVEVVSDSRCPEGATCIWQGEVTCILEIDYLDSTNRKTIVQPGLTQEPAKDTFSDYELIFNVQPYPELGRETKNSEYRLQLTVDKNSP